MPGSGRHRRGVAANSSGFKQRSKRHGADAGGRAAEKMPPGEQQLVLAVQFVVAGSSEFN